MSDYTPKNIEQKWQEKWQESQLFATPQQADKPYYCLDMFPYPSGAGLHVGHPEGYTATDIVSRYKRMNGMDVLHPMGWDAFGLPAENYAIKTGVDPDTSTHQNITTFRRQIQSLGLSYDWNREIDTSSPEYYKWTQWLFLQFYERGLAYKKEAKVNWCDTCQTVLANEQVVDGNCERSKDPVIQKDMEQWFFRTTEYADRLLEDLDGLDWPEPIKLMQRNWIGKSTGAEIAFPVDGSNEVIHIFTTRPDTLFGATYMVLAPEHPLVAQITTEEQQSAVSAYVQATQRKTELERNESKEKTGVFTGAYAVNPANNEKIPVWVADYVLMGYGTGAIMAVPAEDVRDFEFSVAMGMKAENVGVDIEFIPVIKMPLEDDEQAQNRKDPYGGQGELLNSGDFTGMDSEEAKEAITKFVGGEMKTTYKIRDWLISRQRYWGAPIPIVYDPEGNPHPVKEEHLPLTLPTDVDYQPKGTSPIGSSEEYVQRAEELYGEGWRFEVDTMDTFVCSSWYYLRYCDPQNTEAFASAEALTQWLPVDMYVGGAEHAVMHLLYARFFHKALVDMGHIPAEVGPEPFAALRNQGMILGEDHQKMSKSRGNVINPDDVVDEYGADTLRLYEMFMGPFEDVKPWSTQNIRGVRRFLERVSRLMDTVEDTEITEDTQREMHKTIAGVTADVDTFGFNTAISKMMVFTNHLYSLDVVPQEAYATLVTLLAPFAPHLAEEQWAQLGNTESVEVQPWPQANEAFLVEDTVTIAVQVNGKVRGQVDIAPDATEEVARAAAESDEVVQKYTEGKDVVKFIYVPGRIINIVVK